MAPGRRKSGLVGGVDPIAHRENVRCSSMAYVGGKGNCCARVIGAMPWHRVYIETHLGGGAVMKRKRPAERQIGIDRDERVIEKWRLRGCDTELIHGDAATFLESHRFEGDEVVYADPPYPHETRGSGNRYRHEYDDDHHVALLDVLCRIDCMVIISAPPTPLYRERLQGWRTETFTAGARRGARTETLWTNFPPPARLHDPIQAGAGFRAREAMKRRVSTMTSKVAKMDAAERSLFFDWLSTSHPEWARSEGRG